MSTSSDVCNSTSRGVNPPVDRWACPVTLNNNYKDMAYSSCYLMEQLEYPMNISAASPALELQFRGNRTLSFLSNVTIPPTPSPLSALPPAPAATAPTAVLSSSMSKRTRQLFIIFGSISGFLAITFKAYIIFLLCRRGWFGGARNSSSRTAARITRKNIEAFGKIKDYNSPLSDKNHPTTLYTLRELEKATNNFSDDCKLDSGGFGTVYRATLDNGVEVAIKKENRTDMTGISEQFMNEVALLLQVNHRNLVRLLGSCLEVEVPMLVYEYVSNGDLFQHLQGDRCPGMQLSWEKRLQIAIDTAEALRYVHSAAYPPIYHRDMKTSNILLYDKFNVKVADFGIARIVKPDATHVSTTVQGTLGYLDPEYFRTFRLTDKSDVYSFGMVLLELVTSLKPIDFQRDEEDVNLMAMALPFIQEGNVKAIADSRLFDHCSYDTYDILVGQMQRTSELALECLADSRHRRPTMKEVVAKLVATRGVENRGGQDSNEMSDMDHGEVEMVVVLENQSSKSTSGSNSFYTRYSKSLVAPDKLKQQTRPPISSGVGL